MRTTFDIPDEVFKRLKVEAATQGVPMKRLLMSFIEQGLAGRSQTTYGHRDRPLPSFIKETRTPIPLLTSEELDSLMFDNQESESKAKSDLDRSA